MASGAQAFTLFSPANNTNDQLECSLLNVGKINLSVKISVHDFQGNSLGAAPTFNLVTPGHALISNLTSSSVSYCKFVVKASNPKLTARKSMVRAGASFYNGGVPSHSFPAY